MKYFLIITALSLAACSTLGLSDQGASEPDWHSLATQLQIAREHPPMTPEQKTKIDRIQMQLAQLLIKASNGNFDIKGEVADEDGGPLEKVTMTIERYQAPQMGPGLTESAVNGERIESVINGPFKASGKGWWGMQVWFKKDGYYPQSFFFNEEMTPSAAIDLLTEKASPSTVIQNGLHIEMLKRSPKSPTLQEAGATLTFSGDGSGQYLLLSLDQNRRTPVTNYKSADDLKTLPENALALEFSTDPEKKCFTFIGGIPYHLKIAEKISLKLVAKEGGLILTEPRTHRNEMLREAPEKGYQQEITFTPEMMIRTRLISNDRPSPGAIFYFKTADGKYGKGEIQGGINDVKNKAEFHIHLYYQTDGTRNVTSG